MRVVALAVVGAQEAQAGRKQPLHRAKHGQLRLTPKRPGDRLQQATR